jgi:hypothetical protein
MTVFPAGSVHDTISDMHEFRRRLLRVAFAVVCVSCALIVLAASTLWLRSYWACDGFTLDTPAREFRFDSWRGAANLSMCRPLTKGIVRTELYCFSRNEGGPEYSDYMYHVQSHAPEVHLDHIEFLGVVYLYSPLIGPEPTADWRCARLPYWVVILFAFPLPLWHFCRLWRRRQILRSKGFPVVLSKP